MHSPIERPEFYQRIDDALKRRTQLASAIESLVAESHSNAPEVKALIVALRGSPTAEEFVQDGSKAVWLPLILRGVSVDDSSSLNEASLNQITTDLSYALEARTSQLRMFAYPLSILSASVLLFVLLSLTVIPTFLNMFREFELRLPAATQWVMSLSDLIRSRPFMFCFSLLAIAVVAFVATRVFARILQWLETSRLLGFFMSGGTNSVRAMGRFTATLAELLNIGAPLEQAITIAGLASQNLRFRIASDKIAAEIGSSGRFCHESAAAHNFPNLVVHALEAGQDGRPSIGLLRQISMNYVARVQVRFNRWAGLLAPMMLLCVGLGVGFVVLSLFMPLMQLITSLSG